MRDINTERARCFKPINKSALINPARLVRCTTPDGQIRVLGTNFAASDFLEQVSVELYHTRWRIEEAFKRLKHQVKLESASGLTQFAVLVDVHFKVLADNLESLVFIGTGQLAELESANRICKRAYAARCLRRLMPRMVMGLESIAALLDKAFS